MICILRFYKIITFIIKKIIPEIQIISRWMRIFTPPEGYTENNIKSLKQTKIFRLGIQIVIQITKKK